MGGSCLSQWIVIWKNENTWCWCNVLLYNTFHGRSYTFLSGWIKLSCVLYSQVAPCTAVAASALCSLPGSTHVTHCGRDGDRANCQRRAKQPRPVTQPLVFGGRRAAVQSVRPCRAHRQLQQKGWKEESFSLSFITACPQPTVQRFPRYLTEYSWTDSNSSGAHISLALGDWRQADDLTDQ